jgi:hypothetical protein
MTQPINIKLSWKKRSPKLKREVFQIGQNKTLITLFKQIKGMTARIMQASQDLSKQKLHNRLKLIQNSFSDRHTNFLN